MLKLIALPTAKPVSLAQAKAHSRIVDADEDSALQIYLDAATEFVADRCSLVLAPTTFQIDRDAFWSGCFHILVAPVREILSIKYVDTSGALQTVPEENYGFRRTREGGEVELLSNYVLPTVQASRQDAVQIQFSAGYDVTGATGSGDDPELVLPERARQAILLICGHWYEHREAADPVAMHTVPLAAESIMSQLRIWR